MSSFEWHPSEPPPRIEPHSKAKLDVLRRYIQEYFDRLNVNPQREEFRLDLIDGFAGGGTFRDGNTEISGTPLVMLEEAKKAEERLNRKRKKRLHINCKFYFVDKEEAHTDHLRKVLREHGYRVDEDKIVVRTGLFENEVKDILRSIKQRQPRIGRAIFLLDQTGFSQVELSLVSNILGELHAAEVILTFAAESLVNHLAETPQIVKAVSPLQLTEQQIGDLIENKDGVGGRALVQRTLRDHLRVRTGAEYDTPFFIRPKVSRRALWFLHLSRHPTARDVMIQLHWEIQNRFEHYGPGDFGMLGWDALRDSSNLPLFQFGDLDKERMQKELLDSLPGKLHSLVSEQPVTVDAMRHRFANQTAARFSDLDEIVLQLVREKEFQILDPEGKVRSRSLKRLKSTDRIALPPILLFSVVSRIR
ncbi:MAG: three-Cys-motif partner protein TcmP [Candidatus Kaiserbacteria bacterium]|nr:three-Cys-motif partner protein TcmP [Candidatus Kaiserbacteria bacterium]